MSRWQGQRDLCNLAGFGRHVHIRVVLVGNCACTPQASHLIILQGTIKKRQKS